MILIFNVGKNVGQMATGKDQVMYPGKTLRSAPTGHPNLIFDPSNRRINVPTRLVSGLRSPELVDPRTATFELIGIAHSTDQSEDTVFNLYGKPYARDRNRYQYRIVDKETGITINLNNGDPMPELMDDDQITITGKESIGDFTVLINQKDPYLPTYL